MLGLPDVGLITLTEMADRVRCTRAVTNAPLIADADVGYGSLINVRRAMRELEVAGRERDTVRGSGQPEEVWPRTRPRRSCPIEEMEQRLRAAVDGRENPDTLIVARTDARTTHGLAEAIRRGERLCRGRRRRDLRRISRERSRVARDRRQHSRAHAGEYGRDRAHAVPSRREAGRVRFCDRDLSRDRVPCGDLRGARGDGSG